jgi:hypothetical protein
MSSYPFKAEILRTEKGKEIWWTVSSDPDDDMLAGDRIPGDKAAAEYAARCCNMAYHAGIVDAVDLINKKSLVDINVKKIAGKLIKKWKRFF